MAVTQLRQTEMSEDDIRKLCERRVRRMVRVQQLRDAGLSREQLIDEVETVVRHNLESGRAGWVMERDRTLPSLSSEQLLAYVNTVIPIYLQEHRRVKGLGDDQELAWDTLLKELTHRAKNMLRTRSSALEPADFAVQACISIHDQWFPYDVFFDAWATTILRNHIHWPPTRSPDLLDRHPNMPSLDRIGQQEDQRTMYDLLSDPSALNSFDRIEDREMLIDAIKQLPSEDQKAVVVYKFFYDLSDDEIATKLGKTRQAVYSLRHRALIRLKRILIKQMQGDRDS